MLILSGILRKFAARPIVKRLKNIFFFLNEYLLRRIMFLAAFATTSDAARIPQGLILPKERGLQVPVMLKLSLYLMNHFPLSLQGAGRRDPE